MRSRLLPELKSIGYEIFLEGENIRYRYQKPGKPPDTAKPLIAELRECKAEVMNILKMGSTITSPEKSRPQSSVKDSWSPEDESLVDWFMILDPPAEPFYLEPHLHITDPLKFFSAIRMDIEAGPTGPRGKHGVLIHDLTSLKRTLH